MKKILIVEDSRVYLNLIKKQITTKLGFECISAGSFEEVRDILDNREEQPQLAILDLNLPDAPDGEIVAYVVSKNIPSIVITALINDDIRDRIIAQEVLDYIIKEGHQSLEQLTEAIRRYIRNQHITILVVDDSKVSRGIIRRQLVKQNYRVIEANDGMEALDVLKDNAQIRLVITDYNMPNMSGFELTAEIRRKFPMDEMAVIGMSAVGNPVLSAQFLKNGANDFINKPYHEEEFLWRINQNIELLENIMKLKEAAIKDYLTDLFDRRYFYSAAGNLFANAKRRNLNVSIGMVDIDNFKSINDTFGHAAGDKVLQHLAVILKSSFRDSDIVARFGGEEFVIMAANMDSERVLSHFESLRKAVEGRPVKTESGEIPVTISIGVTTHLRNSLEDMIKEADDLLYQAKAAGRNRVMIQ